MSNVARVVRGCVCETLGDDATLLELDTEAEVDDGVEKAFVQLGELASAMGVRLMQYSLTTAFQPLAPISCSKKHRKFVYWGS